MRILDELAEAFHVLWGRPCPRPVLGDVELERLFGLPVTPGSWQALADALRCPLPPLERRPVCLWDFPFGWTTVQHLAYYLATRFPDGELPVPCTAADWREAQVFIGVRQVLIEAGNLDREDIVRSARLVEDLGLE